MGISRGTAKFFLNEKSVHDFNGSVLQLGKQTFYFSEQDFAHWGKEMGVSLATTKNCNQPISDTRFFHLVGFDKVYSADSSNYENPDFIFDLNYPVPEEFHDRFDVIYDGGTMEHCFNTFQVLKNIYSMLKVGGKVIHSSPSTNHVDHGFFMFSPTLFADYYSVNQWKVDNLKIFTYTQNHTTEPWQVYNYTPGCLENYAFGGFKMNKMLGIWSVNEKLDSSTSNKIPAQGFYTKEWDKNNHSLDKRITFDAKNKRIKIFGASKLGQEAYQDLASYADVVGFIDNSEDKMGRLFLNKMTELPSKDIANDCDLILIASLFAPDIYQQLLQLDIPKEKIKCYKLIDSQIPFLNFFQAPITEY